MKICTIIAEFNPLHSGHKKLIDFAKTFADTVVIVMSGNFTQRGLPAVSNKYNRAKHAILAGADAVIELPTIFATASAQNFATAGVQIASQIGSDYLLFGSEVGDITQLENCAKTMLDCEQNNGTIKQLLDQGLSYPQAVTQTFVQYQDLLSTPNNLLAVEYIKAIYRTNSNVAPVTLQRTSNYNDENSQSSKAIRVALQQNITCDFCNPLVLADCSLDAENNFKKYASTAVATMNTDYLSNIEGVSEGIENRIYKFATVGNYDKLILSIKSKRYTQLKLQRILLNSCLGITKQIVQQAKKLPVPVKVLAISKNREDILSQLAPTQNIQNDVIDQVNQLADRLYQVCTSEELAPAPLLKI